MLLRPGRPRGLGGHLDAFKAAAGQPFGTFDHKGTRFILLASSLGTLRGTEWTQLPLLEQALAGAEANAIGDVVVFAHHPVDDPQGATQLADRTEVRLVEKLLSDFRAASHKGVAMIGSHARLADVDRVEGVPTSSPRRRVRRRTGRRTAAGSAAGCAGASTPPRTRRSAG